VGVVLMAGIMLSLVWRAWFFAVDRPRFDLVANRPYSAVTLVPILLTAVLLVQGLVESRPLMEWGWLFIVMFAFKLKQSPLVDVGPREERGSLRTRAERLTEQAQAQARRAQQRAPRHTPAAPKA